MSTQGKQKSRIVESAEQLGGEEAFDLEVVEGEELDAELAVDTDAEGDEGGDPFQLVHQVLPNLSCIFN